MKIDSSVNVNGGNELPPLDPSRTQSSAATPERPGSPNDVSLSADGAKLHQLVSTVQAQPDVRQEKVQSLQQAIQGGTYDVPSHQIANAMLTDLSGTQGGKG